MAYHHPNLGPLAYIITESLTLTGREDLYFVTYVPNDRQTLLTLDRLAQQVGADMQHLTRWPYD